jgi:hypothetical protein
MHQLFASNADVREFQLMSFDVAADCWLNDRRGNALR